MRTSTGINSSAAAVAEAVVPSLVVPSTNQPETGGYVLDMAKLCGCLCYGGCATLYTHASSYQATASMRMPAGQPYP